jgi:putative ABC transport system ATP-binding protein
MATRSGGHRGQCHRLLATNDSKPPEQVIRCGYGDAKSVKEQSVDERPTEAFDFERVTVARAGRRVLDAVTTRIPADGITVVSGPSGAGKTTLLRLCNRLEIPDGGRVCYRGQPLDELDPLVLRRRVGMVFQRPVPFPGSVADNLSVAHPDAGAEELDTAMRRVALDPGLLGREARTLSGGELQRMCLARTLVTQPETLLLDEPTSALDDEPKRVFEDTARDLAAQGITIVWVTHDDAQASRVADRVYRLRDGHLTDTTPEEAGL